MAIWLKKVHYNQLNRYYFFLLFDDNKMKIARKLGKKQKENPAGYALEGKI